MARSPEAYADTGAFIAFLDRSDAHHDLFSLLFSDPPPLITTPLVVAEGHAWFLRRYDGYRGLEFLSFIQDVSAITIVSISSADLGRAADMLRRYAAHPLTMTDALGLYVMKQRGIAYCWSTDRHLSLTGAALAIDES